MSPRPRGKSIGEQIAVQNETRIKNMRSFLKTRTKYFPNLSSELGKFKFNDGLVELRIKAKSPLVKLSDIDSEELADFKKTLDYEVATFDNQELTDWIYSKGITGFIPFWYKQYQFTS